MHLVKFEDNLRGVVYINPDYVVSLQNIQPGMRGNCVINMRGWTAVVNDSIETVRYALTGDVA